MKNHIPAVALQVASLAIAPHAPQFTDPRRLLAALDAFDAPRQGAAPEPVAASVPTFRTLTPAQAAEKMGVSDRQICNWIKDGRLPGKKYGKRTIRILESDLAAFASSAAS